jgi:hypothetical protein
MGGGGGALAKFKQPQYALKQKSLGTTRTSVEDGEHIRVSKEVYLWQFSNKYSKFMTKNVLPKHMTLYIVFTEIFQKEMDMHI